MARRSNLRDFAKGQTCTVRVPGVCNRDTATVVLAHGRAGGMGTKTTDIIGVHACSACHDWLDLTSRIKAQDAYDAHFAFALYDTLGRAIRDGLLKDPR